MEQRSQRPHLRTPLPPLWPATGVHARPAAHARCHTHRRCPSDGGRRAQPPAPFHHRSIARQRGRRGRAPAAALVVQWPFRERRQAPRFRVGLGAPAHPQVVDWRPAPHAPHLPGVPLHVAAALHTPKHTPPGGGSLVIRGDGARADPGGEGVGRSEEGQGAAASDGGAVETVTVTSDMGRAAAGAPLFFFCFFFRRVLCGVLRRNFSLLSP